MAVSMADIQKLRTMTGAGMMDCKNALAEANGDFDKAIEVIRKKGQAFAAKRGDREAAEGCVLAGVNGETAAIVSLNCETDFVAMNADYIALTQSLLDAALANKPADIEALKAVKIEGGSVEEVIAYRMGVSGERMEITTMQTISAPSVYAYIHPGNKLAAIVGFNKPGVSAEVAKDVAMQIAAMNPVSLDESGVTEEIKERELALAREKAREAGKPEELLDRIAQGSLTKFYKDFTLLQQDFIKNPKQSVAQYVASVDKDLKVVDFKRFTLNAE